MMMTMKIFESAIDVLKEGFICDNCLGRSVGGQLLSGLTNKERGKIIRHFIGFLIDSGEEMDVDYSNFYGIKFRNVKIKPKKPQKCKVCKNFFLEEMNKIAQEIVKKMEGLEFKTFLVGSVVSDEVLKNEEHVWQTTGIDYVESIKSEINRELGKIIEGMTRKKFKQKNPDVTFVVDLKAGTMKSQIRSLYILGGYQKLARGIPQTKWVCRYCSGKGCERCKGEGKLYRTSVQEIIEKPMLKATKGKKTSFHGAGREDINARCLGWRPFVIEMVKPRIRKVKLKDLQKQINKSKKVRVKCLKFTTKMTIRKLKSARFDKTYLAVAEFKKPIDRKKLKELKQLQKAVILQKTPLRVVHRRTNMLRKRSVKKISWRVLDKKKLEIKIMAEAGLYIKELINGDEGRTEPNISNILDNKVKKINLDVIKIHTGRC